MNEFIKFISLFAFPLSLLNMFGGIVSGLWLAILGEWGVIGYGLLTFVVSGFGLSIAMMPGILFTIPAIAYHQKGSTFGCYFLVF